MPLAIRSTSMRSRHQEGHVEEAGGKRKYWKGHYFEYVTVDGKERRVHRSINLGYKSNLKKWEAEEKLRKHLGVVQVPDSSITFAQLWQRYLASRAWTEHTRQTIEGIFRLHVLPRFKDRKLPSIDKLEIQEHLSILSASYSASLVKKARTNLTALFEEAVELDLIKRNPNRKIGRIRTKKASSRYLSLDEIRRLLAAIPDYRDQLIVRMFIVLGLRPGELFALRWSDVQGDVLKVDESFSRNRIGDTKTEESDSFVRVPASIRAQLETWRGLSVVQASDDDFVFPSCSGGPISNGNFERDVVIPAAIRAGIMEERPTDLPKGVRWRNPETVVNFQVFRRTCATWFRKAGDVKDAQSHLRHANPETTLRFYVKEIPESVAAAVEVFDQMIETGRPN